MAAVDSETKIKMKKQRHHHERQMNTRNEYIRKIREKRENSNYGFHFLNELIDVWGYSGTNEEILKLRYNIGKNAPEKINDLYLHLRYLWTVREWILNKTSAPERPRDKIAMTIYNNLFPDGEKTVISNVKISIILLNYYIIYYQGVFSEELRILTNMFSIEKYNEQVKIYEKNKSDNREEIQEIINFIFQKLIINGEIDEYLGRFDVISQVFVPEVILAISIPQPISIYFWEIVESKNFDELITNFYSMEEEIESGKIPEAIMCWRNLRKLLVDNGFVPELPGKIALKTLKKCLREVLTLHLEPKSIHSGENNMEIPEDGFGAIQKMDKSIRQTYSAEIESFIVNFAGVLTYRPTLHHNENRRTKSEIGKSPQNSDDDCGNPIKFGASMSSDISFSNPRDVVLTVQVPHTFAPTKNPLVRLYNDRLTAFLDNISPKICPARFVDSAVFEMVMKNIMESPNLISIL